MQETPATGGLPPMTATPKTSDQKTPDTAAETLPAPGKDLVKPANPFPEPPVSAEKSALKRIKGGWKAPAWLLVCAGIVTGLAIGVAVMHQRAVSRSIIVTVNRTPITEDQLLAHIPKTVGVVTVRKMIQDELQLQFAQKKGLAPTDAEVEAQFAKIKQRPNFDQAVASSGLSEADLKHNLSVEMAQTAVITQGVTVSDADIRSYYQAQTNPNNPAAQFYHPPAVSLRAIATATQAKAKQALTDLAAKTPFELAAASYSVDESKQNGGLLTPLVLGRSPLHRDPALEQTIFRMKVGDQIGPVFFANQWWIFQCQDKAAATTVPFDQVQEQCTTGAKLQKGKALNGKRIQAEFVDFQHTANLQPFWDQYKQAIEVH